MCIKTGAGPDFAHGLSFGNPRSKRSIHSPNSFELILQGQDHLVTKAKVIKKMKIIGLYN